MFAAALTERLAEFVRGVGIDVTASSLPANTFLPGLDIRYGALLVDEERLAFAGDMLHEAGHIAVAKPEERAQAALSPSLGDEIATQAWSFAAARHLGLAPDIVFHEHGYKQSSEALIAAFSQREGQPGVPLLAYYGMTVERKNAAPRGVDPYPHMLRWMR